MTAPDNTQPTDAAEALEALNKLGDSSNLPDQQRNALETTIRHALEAMAAKPEKVEGLEDWHDFASKISDMLWGGELGWTRTGLEGMLAVLKERLSTRPTQADIAEARADIESLKPNERAIKFPVTLPEDHEKYELVIYSPLLNPGNYIVEETASNNIDLETGEQHFELRKLRRTYGSPLAYSGKVRLATVSNRCAPPTLWQHFKAYFRFFSR